MKKSYTIAVIEDDESLAKTLSESLSTAGFRVIHTSNGKDGLALISREKPDLILLDIVMPRMDGIQMLRELRKMEKDDSQTPVLVLTNLDDIDRVAAAVELGALGYLQKMEWHLEDVVKKVKEALKIPAE